MGTYFFPRPVLFSLEKTLKCGQCFRWTENEGVWQGIASGHRAELHMDEHGLYVDGEGGADFWRNYLDIDGDYEGYRARICAAHPFLERAAAHAPGIRILHQEPWETLATFIISQNNHIPRITGIVERLCITFGEPCEGGYAFPSPQTLAELTVEELAPIRSGFRAKYLLDAARCVTSGKVDMELCKNGSMELARKELMKIYGVGAKVADCTLLFGFHRLDAFPIDVWMSRAMKKYLPEGLPDEILDIAGVAQQYIFHYMRTGETEICDESGSI